MESDSIPEEDPCLEEPIPRNGRNALEAIKAEGQRSRARLYLLDSFISCGALTVLITRMTLSLTGYPQLGGTRWHFAHALWGGLLLAVGQLIAMLAPRRYNILSAIVGGIGFGLFIDEVGKFTTNNNDYFFEFSGFLMYISFIILWVIARFAVTRGAKLPFFSVASWPRGQWVRKLILGCVGIEIVYGLIFLVEAFYSIVLSNPNPASFFLDPLFDGPWYNQTMMYVLTVYIMWLLLLMVLIIRYNFSTHMAGLLRTTCYIALLSVYPFTMTASFINITLVSMVVNVFIMVLLSDAKVFDVFFFSYWIRKPHRHTRRP